MDLNVKLVQHVKVMGIVYVNSKWVVMKNFNLDFVDLEMGQDQDFEMVQNQDFEMVQNQLHT